MIAGVGVGVGVGVAVGLGVGVSGEMVVGFCPDHSIYTGVKPMIMAQNTPIIVAGIRILVAGRMLIC